jgi:putative transposase
MVETLKTEQDLDVKIICCTLNVSRAGYYAWRIRPESGRERESSTLSTRVREVFERSRGTYGAPRIRKKLAELGEHHGKERIRKLMVKEGLSAKSKRKFVKTTDSKHDLPIAPRIIQTENQETMPVKPNEAWGSDITYIATKEGWLFLAIFLDLFTRKVVGMAMASHMRAELVLEALDSAIGREAIDKNGLTAHSDRGVQFAAKVYRERLDEEGITASMSRKGNCYDNAYVESFFHTLKTELVYRTEFATREEARKAIFEFIEVWYNRERLHSSIGYKSPVEFERLALSA